MADAILSFGIEVEGAASAQAAVGNVTKAIDASATATSRAVAPTRAVGESFQNLVRKAGPLAGGLNNIVGSMSSLSPQLSSATGIVARLAGGFSGATSALGPWGIAIGVASAALPLLIEYLNDTGDATELVTDKFEKATKELDRFINAARSAQQEQSRLALRAADLDSLESRQGEARQALAAENEAAAALSALGPERTTRDGYANFLADRQARRERTANLEAARRARMEAEARVAQEEEERRLDTEFEDPTVTTATVDAEVRAQRGGRAARGPTGPTPEEIANLKAKQEQIAAEADEVRRLTFETDELARAEREAQEAREQGYAVHREALDSLAVAFEAVREQERLFAEEAAEATVASAKVVDDALSGVADTLGGQFTSAVQTGFGALIDGGDNAAASFDQVAKASLKAIAVESVGQALKETALGFANITKPPEFGANHFTAAGIWAAAGAVSGAAAAAIPSAGSGGGGSGPQSGGAGSLSSGGGAGSGEANTYVVNINSPTDRAQLGQQLATVDRYYRQRHQARPGGGHTGR